MKIENPSAGLAGVFSILATICPHSEIANMVMLRY
jgi:hypothetical protein